MNEEVLKRNWKKTTPKIKVNLGKSTVDRHTEIKVKACALTMKELDELLKAINKKIIV